MSPAARMSRLPALTACPDCMLMHPYRNLQILASTVCYMSVKHVPLLVSSILHT